MRMFRIQVKTNLNTLSKNNVLHEREKKVGFSLQTCKLSEVMLRPSSVVRRAVRSWNVVRCKMIDVIFQSLETRLQQAWEWPNVLLFPLTLVRIRGEVRRKVRPICHVVIRYRPPRRQPRSDAILRRTRERRPSLGPALFVEPPLPCQRRVVSPASTKLPVVIIAGASVHHGWLSNWLLTGEFWMRKRFCVEKRKVQCVRLMLFFCKVRHARVFCSQKEKM